MARSVCSPNAGWLDREEVEKKIEFLSLFLFLSVCIVQSHEGTQC